MAIFDVLKYEIGFLLFSPRLQYLLSNGNESNSCSLVDSATAFRLCLRLDSCAVANPCFIILLCVCV